VIFVLTLALFYYLASDDTSQYLVFSTWGTPTEVRSFQRLIDHYNGTKRPKHKVKLSFADHNSYTERLLVQAAAGSMPDVIHLDKKDLPLFVHRRLSEDLSAYISRDTSFHMDAFLPELVPAGRLGGHTYGVPHNFSTLVLYYNRDQFDAEGLPYPDSTWTWDVFLDAAHRLTKTDAAGNIVRYGGCIHIILYTLIYQYGGSVLNASLDSCIVASPEAADALQFDTDLSEKYRVTWNILAQNLQWDDLFAGGRLSMITNGRWAAAWYMRSMPSGAIDVAPLPRGKFRKGAAVNHMMTISAQSTKKDEAWEFLKFLVSEEGQRMVNDDGANIPALRSIVYSDEFLRHHTTPTMHNGVFLDELAHSVGWPFDQGAYLTQHTLQSQMDLAMRRILLGEATAIQSLKIMQDNVNRIIAIQRRVSEPKLFFGSLLFYLCCVFLIVVPLGLWTHNRRTHADGD
jgi:multiple sugar transport system substrate-binding protein